jgi:hypothetical protein
MFAERYITANNLTKELAVRCISETTSNMSQRNLLQFMMQKYM